MRIKIFYMFTLALLSFFLLVGCSNLTGEERQNKTASTVEVLSLQTLRDEGRYPAKEDMPFDGVIQTEFGLVGEIDAVFDFLDGVPLMLPKTLLEPLLDLNSGGIPERGIFFQESEGGVYDATDAEEAALRQEGFYSRSIVIHSRKTSPFSISLYVDRNYNPIIHPAYIREINIPDVYHLFAVKTPSYSFDVYESRALWPDATIHRGFIADSRELFEQMQPVLLLLVGDNFTASLSYTSSEGTGLTKETRSAFLSPENWVILKR